MADAKPSLIIEDIDPIPKKVKNCLKLTETLYEKKIDKVMSYIYTIDGSDKLAKIYTLDKNKSYTDVKKEYRKMLKVYKSGIKTAEPIDIRRCKDEKTGQNYGMIIMENIQPSITLTEYLIKHKGELDVSLHRKIKNLIDNLYKIGIKYGDLHGENILIKDEEPYIIDFGDSIKRILPDKYKIVYVEKGVAKVIDVSTKIGGGVFSKVFSVFNRKDNVYTREQGLMNECNEKANKVNWFLKGFK